MKTALKLCAAFGSVGLIFSLAIGFTDNIVYFTPLLWGILFSGAAFIPTGTGLIINSVELNQRAAASALNQLICNLFGFFLGPIAAALVMDCFPDEIEGLQWGYRLLMWWTFVVLFFICAAWAVCDKYLP